ncbi:MAG TPA: S9 family peptidase [Thermoanaerobaculia bacterium]|nr:S9 family peptidase [Thermoanaerobaculia bacterium]
MIAALLLSALLIPRDVLTAAPERFRPQLSPDGTQLAWLAPDEKKVVNVWIRNIAGGEAKPITFEKKSLFYFLFAADGHHVLFFEDGDGDENDHLFSAAIDGSEVRDLTPFRGVRVQNVIASAARPDDVLVALNLRDRKLFDLYRVNLRSGAVTLAAKNPGDVLSWTADASLAVRAATVFDQTTGRTIIRTGARELISWPFEQSPFFGQVTEGTMVLAVGEKTIDVVSAGDRDTAAAVRLDLKTGKQVAVLASDPKADVTDDGSLVKPLYLAHPKTGKLQAVAFEYFTPEWHFIDKAMEKDFAIIARELPGFNELFSRDANDTKWIVVPYRSDAPRTWYLFDRATKKLTKLFTNRPALEQYTLAAKKPVVIRSRDGLELVSYLTLPVGAEPHNLPLILFPHGGPWSRDHNDADPWVHLMADRGYAVLQVQYRGSTGFGMKFLNASTHELGLKMQNDLIDAVKWAVDQGIADPKRLAVAGASGGGYATLRALTETPDIFRCGVDIFGPADIKRMIESFPPYWSAVRMRWVRRIGDVIHDDAFNRRISPIFHMDQIKVPVLVEAGVNDPRVPIDEMEASVKAMRAAGRDVTFVVYPDEGHGIDRPENALDFFGRMEEFLAKCLGGRAEPWRKIEGSSVEVR